MIVGPASRMPRPDGGPTAPAFASSSIAAFARSRGSPLPCHSSGQVGTAQPESARRAHHSASVRSGSQLSATHSFTSLRTRSAVMTATSLLLGSARSARVEQLEHLLGGSGDDGPLTEEDDGSLHQLRMLEE